MIGIKAAVVDRDHGWRALERELNRTKEHSYVSVGIQGAQASAQHGDDGVTNVEIATVHEFGAVIDHPGGTPYLPTQGGAQFVSKDWAAGLSKALPVTKPHKIPIPERSFIRATVDEHQEQYGALVTRLLGNVIDGKFSTFQALGLFGTRVVADMRRRIQRGIEPPLSDATVQRKGSSKPLIDSGQLVNSITYEVQTK